MRGIVAAGAVLASVVTAGGFVASRYRGRQRPSASPVAGIFGNGMAYVRWGDGPKKLLIIPGGPDNMVPRGMQLSAMVKLASLLVANGYTAWAAARKQHMPEGYGILDMAGDYAQLIADEFDGHVDTLIGVSYGGRIALALAARHPEGLTHMVCAGSGHAADGPANEADVTYARLLVDGRTSEAMALHIGHGFPQTRRWGIARVLGAAVAPLFMRGAHPYYAGDTLVEAEAQMDFDARSMLPDIRIPVLVVGGGADQYFARDVTEETARLIPDSSLRVYDGKDHLGTFTDKRLPRDILDFVEQQAVVVSA